MPRGWAGSTSNERYGPVGSVVFSSYWREHYTVLSHNDDGSVTVRWHGDGRHATPFPPRETTHRTPLDERDVIVSLSDGAYVSAVTGYTAEDLDRLGGFGDPR